MVIESTRNETVKRARALAQRKGRLEQGVHFIEGEKLVREAVVSGAQFVDAFIEDGHDLMAAVLSGSECIHGAPQCDGKPDADRNAAMGVRNGKNAGSAHSRVLPCGVDRGA